MMAQKKLNTLEDRFNSIEKLLDMILAKLTNDENKGKEALTMKNSTRQRWKNAEGSTPNTENSSQRDEHKLLSWFQVADESKKTISWTEIKEMLLPQARSRHDESLCEQLLEVRQTGTVGKFVVCFEKLVAPLQGRLAEEMLVGLFFHRLEPTIRAEIRMIKPHGLTEIMNMAQIIEDRNKVLMDRIRSKRVQTQPNSHPPAQEPKPNPNNTTHPPIQKQNNRNKNINTINRSKRQRKHYLQQTCALVSFQLDTQRLLSNQPLHFDSNTKQPISYLPTRSRLLTEAKQRRRRREEVCKLQNEKQKPRHICMTRSLPILIHKASSTHDDRRRSQVMLEDGVENEFSDLGLENYGSGVRFSGCGHEEGKIGDFRIKGEKEGNDKLADVDVCECGKLCTVLCEKSSKEKKRGMFLGVNGVTLEETALSYIDSGNGLKLGLVVGLSAYIQAYGSGSLTSYGQGPRLVLTHLCLHFDLLSRHNKPHQASACAVTSGTIWALKKEDFRVILMSEFWTEILGPSGSISYFTLFSQ